MVRRLFSSVALSVLSVLALHAQVGTGSLKGKITDKKSSEPLPFVNVVIENRGTQVSGGATDFDGNYFIKPIDPGTYDVIVSYVGYQPYKQTGVVVSSNKITFLDIALNAGVELKEFEVVQYTVPLIDRDGGASGGTVTREDIARMPGRSANSIATTVAGASDAGTGGGISIRGSRSENTYYYIDGVKVPAGAGTGLPKSAIEEVQVITGGVPANYGDVTGGLINITTRGPSREFFGGLEYLTSGYKVGSDITDIVGLDKYAFNQLEASLSGPLLFKRDSIGNKTKPLIGFFFSGQYTNVVDNDPLYIGDLRARPEVREDLLNNPARLIPNNNGDFALAYGSEFLRSSDLESIKTRQNAGRVDYLASGKIDITTTPTINLTVGGSLDYSDRQSFNRANSLLNSENNIRIKATTWRAFVKFTQRFTNRSEEDEKKATIKNAFYTLQLDYSQFAQNVEDQVHGDRFFDYGYVGKFNTFRAPQFAFNDTLADVPILQQIGETDTLVTFTPGEQNPDLASVNNYYFNTLPRERYPVELLFGAPNNFSSPGYIGYFQNFDETQARGVLWNGLRPRTIYGLWNNIGFIDNPDGSEYTKRQNDQVRFTASGSADIGSHAVSVGVEYEQLTQRRYDLVPVGLWTRARQLANFHVREWQDTAVTNIVQFLPSQGTLDLYFYSRNVGDDQTNFDRNLRSSLGLDPDGNDLIEVDALDPSAFALDMFSPEELINNGNSSIAFVGYDYLGNRTKGRASFDDFFDERDEDGNYTRAQAPFQPIYMAGYVMDKFAFDDIIFNVGVRVDRYDANTSVLKDKYLFGEAYSAGSEVPNSEIAAQLASRPSNIGDDFVVYVNSIDNPSEINGYRDGDTWYNAQGQELADGNALQEGGTIIPYLVGGEVRTDLQGTSPLRKSAFKDYTPVVNVMPRVAFSFPISDEAVFFAHYDVLTQRPNAVQSRPNMVDYAYLENTGNRINNPDLRPTKTIDYELGFQQVLSKSSSLKLAAFYRELRDQIQVRNVANAWPTNYRTFDNFDFGTVKGFTSTFDLRRTGNVSMRASYTLQFADGTGSGPESGLSLVNSGQPNLRNIAPLDFDQRHRFQVNVDFRYGAGKDYNGPMLGGKAFLQGTGINIVSILGSGTPYSRSSAVVSEGTGQTNYRLDGTLNGARLPWQFTTDVQLDRDIPLSFGGEGDKAKSANLNVYVLVSNLFNTENITGVYRFTGSPTNDGYLAQLTDRNQIDPDSYRDLYTERINNPFNFGAPRTIRLGVRFDF
ncbi:MAG: carboxypeptidase-like regulatory domain-containing protein [Flavobacteriales bacterium]|nr:carboxypeptidase-like regulatory domain-containing protein [Flavobacteriales bacterium]MBP7449291.1 carboxypeptidase-like regulatory domain-containing protein [Flavobacteriales bacterium]